MSSRLILGIDPGIARMGYGLVEAEGNRIRPVDYGCIETFPDSPVPARLGQIYRELTQIIQTHRPSVMAVEELFFYRNTTTAFVVGQARGVALLCAVQADMSVAEYTPMQVKQAVTGYGRADKKQIQEMVRVLLNLNETPKPDDTADALAIAITYAHTSPLNDQLSGRLRDDVRTTDRRQLRTVQYGRDARR